MNIICRNVLTLDDTDIFTDIYIIKFHIISLPTPFNGVGNEIIFLY